MTSLAFMKFILSQKTLPILAIFCFLPEILAQNVQISKWGYYCEPSICIHPKDSNIMVAGSVLNQYHYSKDGGKKWKTKKLKSSYGVFGDPVIEVDTAGVFYFLHLANPPEGNWIDRIVCQKSLNNGKSWSNGTFVGLNGQKAQDKHWTAVDPRNNNLYVTWTEFDKYGSTTEGDSTRILFSRSEDQGETWSLPVQINEVSGDCIDSDETVEGATPTVGPNGEVYVSWVGPNGLVFNKSMDHGRTWLEREVFIDSVPGGWDFSIPGLDRANGLPVTKCDLSSGPNNGTIYVNWADQRNDSTDTDIWLSSSKDGGITWAKPVRVNDDSSKKHQFFTWMDIDQKTGYLYFVFYDRRAYNDNQTDVYIAESRDGGKTFKNVKISEKPFIPIIGPFFGDYNNIYVNGGVLRAIWTRYENGKTSIWTDISKLEDLFVIGH